MSSVAAQTSQPTLGADLGFGGVFRPDTWTPVFVHATDAQARPATIEIRTTRGRVGHVIEARVFTSTKPSTFTLYAPVGTFDRIGTFDHITVQLRAADGGLIAAHDLTGAALATPAALGGPVFGVSGPVAAMTSTIRGLVADTNEQVAAGPMPLALLPDRPLGYASIDVLVLPELNTDAIDDAAETSIIRWIRAGGIVVAWPGGQTATMTSPLRALLPAAIGDLVAREVAGGALVERVLTRSVADKDVAELSDGDHTAFARRVGLGQIVLCAADPNVDPRGTAESRVALWRRLTSNQLRLLASERRAGYFDPLVAEARGEQAIASVDRPATQRPWLLLGLLLSLAMGPGELVLLAAARRHPRTALTMTGLTGCVAFSVGLAWYAPTPPRAAHVDVVVEADDGAVASIRLANDLTPDAQATWLSGERLDPTRQTAGELALGQRVDGFQTAPIITLGGPMPKVRSVALSETLAPVAIEVRADGIRNATDEPWSAFATATPSGVALAAGTVANGATVRTLAPVESLPATTAGRVATGIEQLAAQPGWEALLIDRTFASRLTTLQESEGATIYVARIERVEGPKFVVHVGRVARAP